MNEIEQHRIFCRFSFFCCRCCYGIFESKSSLNIHQNKFNHFTPKQRKEKTRNNRKFKCEICKKLVGTNYDLKIHLRTHKNERCEECKFCGKKFCDPATLRKHIKYIHTDNGLMEKQFVCRKCHKRFRWKNSLKTHLQTQHQQNQNSTLTLKERKVYVCPVNECQISFTYKSNCNAHLKKFHPECVIVSP